MNTTLPNIPERSPMSSEALFRAFARDLDTYRFKGTEHLIDFLRGMSRRAERHASDLGARERENGFERRAASGNPRKPYHTTETIHSNGRTVLVTRKRSF